MKSHGLSLFVDGKLPQIFPPLSLFTISPGRLWLRDAPSGPSAVPSAVPRAGPRGAEARELALLRISP